MYPDVERMKEVAVDLVNIHEDVHQISRGRLEKASPTM